MTKDITPYLNPFEKIKVLLEFNQRNSFVINDIIEQIVTKASLINLLTSGCEKLDTLK